MDLTIKDSCSSVPLMRVPDHPPYAEMIGAAITFLGEEGGSSEASISKYITSNYIDLPSAHDNLLSYHLSKLIRLGEIHQLSTDSYILPTFQNPNPNPSPICSLPPERRPYRKHQPSAERVSLLTGPPDQSAGRRTDDRAPEPVRRGRRPKQSPGQPTDDPAPEPEERSGEPVQKRRGRPPKQSHPEERSCEPVRRKQGRPPMQSPGQRTDGRAPDPEERSSEPVGKKQGQLPTVEGANWSLSVPMNGSDGFTPRRRGRPRKDQIAEAAMVMTE